MTTSNKYDIFIKDFLSINKLISFEKIGTLQLESNTPGGEDSPPFLLGNLSFEYNKKAHTTNELITYIAEKTSKNKTLIESDIYSYLDQARELMNTGKPWILYGVGVFSINMAGDYQFSVTEFKPEDNKSAKKERPQKDSDRNRNEKSGGYAVKILTFFIVTALIAGLIWVAYEYFLKDKFAVNQNTQTISDTALQHNGVQQDSIIAAPAVINAGDSVSFEFVFETTPLLSRAQERTITLKKYGNNAGYDSVKTDTGTVYNMYILKKAITADTAAIRDSLAKFLKKPVWVHIRTQ